MRRLLRDIGFKGAKPSAGRARRHCSVAAQVPASHSTVRKREPEGFLPGRKLSESSKYWFEGMVGYCNLVARCLHAWSDGRFQAAIGQDPTPDHDAHRPRGRLNRDGPERFPKKNVQRLPLEMDGPRFENGFDTVLQSLTKISVS